MRGSGQGKRELEVDTNASKSVFLSSLNFKYLVNTVLLGCAHSLGRNILVTSSTVINDYNIFGHARPAVVMIVVVGWNDSIMETCSTCVPNYVCKCPWHLAKQTVANLN